MDLIDVEKLLKPVEGGDQASGADLRSDYSPTSIYQRLRDARSAARTEERNQDGGADDEFVVADGWRDVLSLGQEAFEKSKDFEIAAWLTEASVRVHGLPGLTAGATLLSQCCERYWDDGFPVKDDEGWEGRISPVGGLSGQGVDGTLMQPLRRQTLFRLASGQAVAVYQWEQAEEAASLPTDRRKARLDAGVLDYDKLSAEARVNLGNLSAAGRHASIAARAVRDLESALDARLGADAPSMRNVMELLQKLVSIVEKLGGTIEGPADAVGIEETAAPTSEGTTGIVATKVATPGAINSREDALRELNRISDYFRKTEPHSPLAYTLDEAVRRGRMTLADLLAEVLPNDEARTDMLLRLGIRPKPPEE